MATTTKTKKSDSSQNPKREGKFKRLLHNKQQNLVSLSGLKDALDSENCCVNIREVKSLDEFIAAYMGMIQAHFVPNSKMMLPWKAHIADSYVCFQTNGCGYFSLVVFGTWDSYCQLIKEDDADDE